MLGSASAEVKRPGLARLALPPAVPGAAGV